MTVERRVGSKSSKKRALILEAAEQVLAEEGYAAVTSRSVAARVGAPSGLVHYYFPTLDDLFVAMINRGADINLKRMAGALASPQPLTALWRLSSDRRGVTVVEEIIAASHHRKALRERVTSLAETTRGMQLEALQELLPQYGIDEDRFPPALVAAAIQGIALLVAREETLGVATGHDTARAAVEAILEDLERERTGGSPQSTRPSQAPTKRRGTDRS
jgi:AcrR family transcriptional regulator